MKNLRLFDTIGQFNINKDNVDKPYVVSCKDGKLVYSASSKEDDVVELATVLYGTADQYYYPMIDLDEYYVYDDTIDVNGETYYKWKKVGTDEEYNNRFYILTDTRDFSNVDLNHPASISGCIMDDEMEDGYHDFTIYYGGKEQPTKIIDIPYHNTSLLNANGHEYVDLGLPSGTLWAKCNVGAESEEKYGNFYAWGETTPKYSYDWLNYEHGNDWNDLTKYNIDEEFGVVDNKLTLELDDDAARVNMGGDWHMPNNKLICELLAYTTHEVSKKGEINGRLFTSKINGNTLFIPFAGCQNGSDLFNRGVWTDLWSSSLDGSGPDGAILLFCNSDNASLYVYGRSYGLSVRGVLY